MTPSWVVKVSERRGDVARIYQSPSHERAADARSLAAIILDRSHVMGDGPWTEPIAGGQRTVSIEHAFNDCLF